MSPTDRRCRRSIWPTAQVLDKILLDAAIEAGVEVREAFTVEEILIEAEHVFWHSRPRQEWFDRDGEIRDRHRC